MSAREILMLAIAAITQAAKDRAIDYTVHQPDLDSANAGSVDQSISLRTTDGTKIRTYKIQITLEEEF